MALHVSGAPLFLSVIGRLPDEISSSGWENNLFIAIPFYCNHVLRTYVVIVNYEINISDSSDGNFLGVFYKYQVNLDHVKVGDLPRPLHVLVR